MLKIIQQLLVSVGIVTVSVALFDVSIILGVVWSILYVVLLFTQDEKSPLRKQPSPWTKLELRDRSNDTPSWMKQS